MCLQKISGVIYKCPRCGDRSLDIPDKGRIAIPAEMLCATCSCPMEREIVKDDNGRT